MNKIKFNITEHRDIEAKMWNFKNIDEKYIFYYDETNNIKKFWLKEKNKLNISQEELTKNFVLGGLVYNQNETQFNIDELKKNLKLQKTIKEIKFEHIAKGDFISCMELKKLEIYLDWLYSNDIYIHYSSLNILYWAIVDIIDSITSDDLSEFNLELKTILYELANIDLDSFLNILYTHDYPNIKREQSEEFLHALFKYIESNLGKLLLKYDNFSEFINSRVSLILLSIKKVDTQNLTFIMDEEDYILIDHFGYFYLRTLGIFKNSLHIFDEESDIQKFFSKYDLYDGTNKWENLEFKDSKSDSFIQLSDVIVGLLGKFFDYINNCDFESIMKIKDNLNSTQQKNFSTLAKLLLRSDNQSLAFVQSIQGLIDKEKFSLILRQFLKK